MVVYDTTILKLIVTDTLRIKKTPMRKTSAGEVTEFSNPSQQSLTDVVSTPGKDVI
jgi:hypothetical protein